VNQFAIECICRAVSRRVKVAETSTWREPQAARARNRPLSPHPLPPRGPISAVVGKAVTLPLARSPKFNAPLALVPCRRAKRKSPPRRRESVSSCCKLPPPPSLPGLRYYLLVSPWYFCTSSRRVPFASSQSLSSRFVSPAVYQPRGRARARGWIRGFRLPRGKSGSHPFRASRIYLGVFVLTSGNRNRGQSGCRGGRGRSSTIKASETPPSLTQQARAQSPSERSSARCASFFFSLLSMRRAVRSSRSIVTAISPGETRLVGA